MSQLYQYAAILDPSAKELEDGVKPKLIVEVQTVLAPDQQSALLLAARAIPDEFVNELDRIRVVVTSF